jgi:hypothetical protein
MECEEGELDGFIEALLHDTTLLIGEFGIDTTPAGVYDRGSVRYQKVATALGQLEYIERTLGIKDRLKWERTELTNRRTGDYLVEKLAANKKHLQQLGEGYPPAS